MGSTSVATPQLSTPSSPKTLSPDEANHFLTRGWLKVPNAISPRYIDPWVSDLWTRTGYDEHDKSTWKEEYYHMAHHRQVRHEEFAPKAWEKIADICGGEEMIDPERERWVGDNFICNFGSEERSKAPKPKETGSNPGSKYGLGFHVDNDWYRYFLDSSSTALTIAYCFSDIPPGGGGTVLCEDGIGGIVNKLYRHPEGLDPPDEQADLTKKGDAFIMHGMLPHVNSYNYLHYARVITNPHVTLREPYNLNRPDGNYTLLERVILRNLERESVPEYKPTRERKFWYARNITFKLDRVDTELDRMLAAAKSKGLDESSVDSFYLRGDAAVEDFKRNNGLLLPINEDTGLHTTQHPI